MDIYKAVTDHIISQLNQGIIPWHKLWIACCNTQSISHVTGKPYSLLNQMILGKPCEYITFKQCQQEGGKVRKGEEFSIVHFWKFIEQEDEETYKKKQVPFLRYYNMFHIDQCEVIKAKHAKSLQQHAQPDETANRLFLHTSSAAASSSSIRKVTEHSIVHLLTALLFPCSLSLRTLPNITVQPFTN